MITFVGMGPGDPELMTVKAVKAIENADVVALVESETGSTAAAIAGDLLDGKEIVRLYMPMRGGRAEWESAHADAENTLSTLLDAGKNVVYLVLGDPMLYATSSYLLKRLQPRHETSVIPGVTAMCATAAALQVPLCEDREPLTILPGFPEGQALPEGNVVVMKAGRSLERIEEAGAQRPMYLARNLGMREDSYLGPLCEADKTRKDYFSTVLVKSRG